MVKRQAALVSVSVSQGVPVLVSHTARMRTSINLYSRAREQHCVAVW